jgi:hypothetical protein
MSGSLKCPVCNSEIDIDHVIAHYGFKGFVPMKQGIRCRRCHTVLDIVQYKIILFSVVLMAGFVVLLDWLSSVEFSEKILSVFSEDELGTGIAIVLLAAFGYPLFRSFDWFTELRATNPADGVRSDDEIWTDPNAVDPEFTQYIAEEMKLAGEDVDTGVDPLPSDWLCNSCGESNEKEFHFCWSCQSPHSQTGSETDKR